MKPQTIEIAALGRSLFPGMLYDCRRDSFIPGVTLWDKASLSKDLDVHHQPKTDLKFSASDSLQDKASFLNVSASLKASFLSGLVEVGGSARYLCDKKTSEHQSRFTMQYSQTTRFEQLTMNQLGKITYPEVFEKKMATHVITAVLYGAQAFMVFEKTASENEDKQEVEGNLSVMVKKIPSFCSEGEGAVKMNENEKKMAENISCIFYGDYQLEEVPTTYTEVLQLYKKLPSLLREREKDAVPVKVWLYPLSFLVSTAAKVEKEINIILISQVEGLLEKLESVQRRCSDLVQNRTVNDFQVVKERLQIFQDVLQNFVELLQQALSRILPAIRGGEANDDKLADILCIQDKSPFKVNKLRQWLENAQSEVHLLTSYTKELSDVPVITSIAQFNDILFDPMVDTVVCFAFTSVKYRDPYLSTLKEFLTADLFEKLPEVPKSSVQNTSSWFSDPEISAKMKENFSLFRSFSKANKDQKKTRFVIAPVSDPSNPGISIRLYRQGRIATDHFQPVSKPPAPSVDIQNNNVVLKLQKSPTGVTVRYRLEYRVAQSDASEDDGEAWETTYTPDTQETFTLTGLQLANQYRIRYRAVSDVGESEATESVLFFYQGKVTVTVDRSWSQHYQRPLTGGLKAGQALFFQGVVSADPSRFAIDLETSQNDIVFHFNPRFKTCSVVLNSLRQGNWGTEEWTSGRPFVKGEAFDMFMVVRPECYEV
ncbi:hypothetical protein NFI96_026901, partial [Prochilodus magdalenae]